MPPQGKEHTDPSLEEASGLPPPAQGTAHTPTRWHQATLGSGRRSHGQDSPAITFHYEPTSSGASPCGPRTTWEGSPHYFSATRLRRKLSSSPWSWQELRKGCCCCFACARRTNRAPPLVVAAPRGHAGDKWKEGRALPPLSPSRGSGCGAGLASFRHQSVPPSEHPPWLF